MSEDKKKILVIDDEPQFTRLVKLNLERTGSYEVKEENLGAHGVKTAREFKPDVILLDIMMPDMDGATVLRQIRMSEGLENAKVLFLTAILTPQEAMQKNGFIGDTPCLAKPISTRDLIAHIEE